MNRYPCVNALAEGHPSNYYWVEGSNNLCVHCQVCFHLFDYFDLGLITCVCVECSPALEHQLSRLVQAQLAPPWRLGEAGQ